MSDSDEVSFSELHEDQDPSSVYDIIYHDARRIGSYLSQFETYGIPQTVKSTEKAIEGQTQAASAMVKAKVPLLVEGSGTGTWSTHSTGENWSEQTYDPLWRNALRFLDYLTDVQIIQSEILEANIGQFVIASGDLAIFDMSFLKSAWDNPFIAKMMTEGAIQIPTTGTKAQIKADKYAQEKQMKEGILPLIKMLPHAIVSTVSTTAFDVWCNLSQENLVSPATEIMLKHGVSIPGTWNILGILDAYPDGAGSDASASNILSNMMAANTLGSLGTMVGALVPAVRNFIGRPVGAYGITPLLIFRKIN